MSYNNSRESLDRQEDGQSQENDSFERLNSDQQQFDQERDQDERDNYGQDQRQNQRDQNERQNQRDQNERQNQQRNRNNQPQNNEAQPNAFGVKLTSRKNKNQIQAAPGSAEEALQQIQLDDPNTKWCIFKWDNGLVIHSRGAESFDEMKSSFQDDQIQFGFIRLQLGSDKRNKFVFIKWIGEGVKPIKRARAFDDCRRVTEIVRSFHIEFPASRQAELQEDVIMERLKSAAGANYDKLQNTNASEASKNSNHQFGSYKQTSKEFFEKIQNQGNLKNYVYETKPLSRNTPVDLSNRAMTVGASSAKSNIVDLRAGNQRA